MLTIEDLKNATSVLAIELAGVVAETKEETPAASGGGSRQRAMPEPLRLRFVAVRTELFQRGVFDPVLVRFDTATVTQATLRELAEELAKVAESIR